MGATMFFVCVALSAMLALMDVERWYYLALVGFAAIYFY